MKSFSPVRVGLFVVTACTAGAGSPDAATTGTPSAAISSSDTGADAGMGVVRTITGQIEAGAGGLEVDAAGWIYTGDFGTSLSQATGKEVHRVDPDTGEVSVFAQGLLGASGNAFAADGALIQASAGGNRLSRIEADGTVSTIATGLNAPIGVVVDSTGDIFVNNCGAASISRVGPTGDVTTHAQSELLNCPNGLALAGDGNLYVSNFGDGNVLRVRPNGDVSVFVEVPGGANAHILWGNERLYVVGRNIPRIYELDINGTLRPLAGSGERGSADGDALTATLGYPNDLALSPDARRLYFNDVPPGSRSVTPTVIRVVELPDR